VSGHPILSQKTGTISRFVTTETPIGIEILRIDVLLQDFASATKGIGRSEGRFALVIRFELTFSEICVFPPRVVAHLSWTLHRTDTPHHQQN